MVAGLDLKFGFCVGYLPLLGASSWATDWDSTVPATFTHSCQLGRAILRQSEGEQWLNWIKPHIYHLTVDYCDMKYTHIYIYICISIHTYTQKHIHIYLYIHSYAHIYKHTHIHYIYTHIHIWSSWSYITNIRIAKLTFIGTESSFKSLKRLFKLKTPILVCPGCDNKSSPSGQQKFLTVPAVRRVQTMVQKGKNVSLAKFKIEAYNHQS